MRELRVRRATALVCLLLCPPGAFASQDYAAQKAEEEWWRGQLASAEQAFNSPRHEEAARALEGVIDGLTARRAPLTVSLRAMLVRALALHAELMVNLGRPARARSGFARVLALDPNYSGGTELSEDARKILEEVKAGRRALAATASAQPAAPAPATEPRPTQPPSQRPVRAAPRVNPREPFRAPRALLLRGNATYQTHIEPLTASSFFTLYGRPAQYSASMALAKKGAPDGYELGATLRLWRAFSVGVTRSEVTVPLEAMIEAEAPHPLFGYTRWIEGGLTGLRRTETATHVEVGVMVGDDDFELLAFVGPSWLTTTQDAVVSLSILESGGNPSLAGGNLVELNGASRVGFNMGLDVSWMFLKFVGAGIAARYVRSDVEFEEPAGGIGGLVTGGGQVSFGARVRF